MLPPQQKTENMLKFNALNTWFSMQCCFLSPYVSGIGVSVQTSSPRKAQPGALCSLHTLLLSWPLTLDCFSTEHGGQRSHLHHLLSSVSSHAAGQAPQQRGGHSHPALDFHQILPGEAQCNDLISDWEKCSSHINHFLLSSLSFAWRLCHMLLSW